MKVVEVERKHSWKRVVWGLAGLLGLGPLAFLAIFARWFWLAGWEGGFDAMVRFLQHGSTTIEDFRYYPARRLTPSESPFQFAEGAGGRSVPELVEIARIGERRLDEVLAETETIAFLVIADDTIVLERYDRGHTAGSLSQYFSVSKSITSALVGAAIDDGFIDSVEQPAVSFVPELGGRGLDRLTIRELLTMTSGIDYVENDNPFGLHVPFNYTSDLEHMMLAFEAGTDPGTEFSYKSGDSGLLALILSRALAPKTITEYAQERLWTPLGMESEGIWSLDREGGLEKSWCCLAGTARDLAKVGRLYLERGSWNGVQVLPPGWIEASVEVGGVGKLWPADFAAAGFRDYGYSWWLLAADEGDYLAQGKDGQFLYVNPLRRTIVVRLGRGAGDLRTSQWASLFRFLASGLSRP